MSLKPGEFVITDRLPAAPEKYDRENEQRFRRILELTRFQATGGGANSRAVITKTTATLASCAEETGTIALTGPSTMLIVASATYPSRLRLYPNAAARTADAGRASWSRPVPGTGVLADIVFDASTLTIEMSPAAYLYNNDSPVANVLYYAIENRDTVSRAVMVSLTQIVMEA